jgi:phage anti-repressor protein
MVLKPSNRIKDATMSNIVTVIDFQADIDRPFPINLRDLHAGIAIKKDYSDWVKVQINLLQLVVNIDYVVFPFKGEKSTTAKKGRALKEYYSTLNAAQHIAMRGDGEKCMAYRQAFIDLERSLHRVSLPNTIQPSNIGEAHTTLLSFLGICDLLEIPKHLAQIESVKETRNLTGVDLSTFLLLAPAQDNIKKEDAMLEPTEIGKELSLGSAIATNKWIKDKGLQVKVGNRWEATDKAKGQYSKHAWVKGNKSGYNLKWNVEFLRRFL